MAFIEFVKSKYEPMEEGWQTLEVVEIEHKPEFKKLKITYKNAKNQRIWDNFTLDNEKSAFYFTLLAKALLQTTSANGVDPKELLGKFIWAEIRHTEKDGNVYANRWKFEKSNGYKPQELLGA